MKVKLIPQRCIACGLCQTYSSVFDYDDEGIVKFSQDDSTIKDLQPDLDVLRAVKECPTKALEIEH